MNRLKLLAAAFTLLTAFACSKKDTATPTTTTTTSTTTTTVAADVKPLACFTTTPSGIAEIGKTISMADCSNKAFSYQWDFGDGSAIVTERQPNHVYTTAGKYTIKLRIFSATKVYKDSATASITIGSRYISKIIITKLNFYTVSGDGWDKFEKGADTVGPDLYIAVGPSGKTATVTTAPVYDVTPSTLATSAIFDFKAAGIDYVLKNETTDFTIGDKDVPVSDIIGTITTNAGVASSSPLTVSTKDGKNTIQIFYEIK